LKKEWLEKFAIILHPFVPHFAEELWEIINIETSSESNQKFPVETSIYGVSNKENAINQDEINQDEINRVSTEYKSNKSIFFANWPKYDENLVKDDVIII